MLSPAPVTAQGEGFAAVHPLDCVINPSVVADLGSGSPGVLDRVRVERSDFVKAGEVVAELESGVETAALELARARAAEFGLQVSRAGDQQALAELEMLYAEQILKRRTIRTPIDGVVMTRFKVAGESVGDQPVVRVAKIDPLHVEVTVPVEWLGFVRNGMQARVWTGSAGSATWQATVERIDPIADTASGTYGVRLSMSNPDHLIPVGLRCRMQFLSESAAELVEPESHPALTTEDGVHRIVVAGAVVSEDARGPESPGEPADLTVVEPAAGNLCGWLGPYASSPAAKAAARPLRKDGVAVRVLQRPGQKMVGFKIVSPPMYSNADLKAYLRRLRDAGMKDFVPLSKKQGARRVALGVYHSRGPAEERVRELEAKGFEVEIGPWYQQKEMHWVLVQGDAALIEPQLAQELAQGDGERPAQGLCDRLASR